MPEKIRDARSSSLHTIGVATKLPLHSTSVLGTIPAIVNIRWFAAALLVLGLLAAELPAAIPTNAIPARNYDVRIWTTDEDLPQNSVLSMLQTRDGYLWVGTLNGLARFDGIRFTTFDGSNTRELKDSRIVCLFEDS